MPIVGAPVAPGGGTTVLTDGSYANPNWAEVFYTDHDFSGRTILTNGLLLLDLSVTLSRLARVYLWSTGLATPAWQLCADLLYEDNANNIAVLRQISTMRVGAEESALSLIASTSAGQAARINLRLQRGRFECRADLTPLTQATTGNLSLALTLPAVPKIIYNSTKIADVVLSETSPAFATDYGYGAAFIASSAQPYIVGTLYQNEPGTSQPYSAGNVATIGLGDTTSLAVNAQRSYGFFAIPYGVNATYSTANLQQEMESATLSGGFVSTVDAGSSAGSAAKLPNTTIVGAIAVQTGWRPAVGVYDCWARMRVTSAASGTNQLQIGFYDITGAAYIGSTTYAPSGLTTGYVWYKVAAGITCGNSASQGFRVISVTNTAATDFWIDEMALVPKTLTADNRGPQDIWQQFAYDRSQRLVRP